jgi:hypothetical protein
MRSRLLAFPLARFCAPVAASRPLIKRKIFGGFFDRKAYRRIKKRRPMPLAIRCPIREAFPVGHGSLAPFVFTSGSFCPKTAYSRDVANKSQVNVLHNTGIVSLAQSQSHVLDQLALIQIKEGLDGRSRPVAEAPAATAA